MDMNKIIQIFNNSNIKSQIPIWLMRQAGRYLPEYREVRATVSDFFDLCYNPNKAAEVTMQPIRRFDFDAAIIFSDILVLPDALGVDIKFIKNYGPQVQKKITISDVTKLQLQISKVNKVYTAIKLVREMLDSNKSLIGFCGGVWTVLFYLLGYSSKQVVNYNQIRTENEQEFLIELINILTTYTIEHLSNQISAGADIIQIFDSWAGILPESEFYRYVIVPTAKIVHSLKSRFPQVKIIGFPRGAASKLYLSYVQQTKVDVISCDYEVSLTDMAKLQEYAVVQGNLDPKIMLFSDSMIITSNVLKILQKLGNGKLIFNLGHGILPQTPIQNVELITKLVKDYYSNA